MNLSKVRLNSIIKPIYSYVFSSEVSCPLYLKYSIISTYKASSGDANLSLMSFCAFFNDI